MDKKLKSQHISAATEKDNEDDQSDKGTYTIELENPNSEEMEARKMIDKEGSVAPGSKRWVSQWASLAANHTRHDQDDIRLESPVPAPLENAAGFLQILKNPYFCYNFKSSYIFDL